MYGKKTSGKHFIYEMLQKNHAAFWNHQSAGDAELISGISSFRL